MIENDNNERNENSAEFKGLIKSKPDFLVRYGVFILVIVLLVIINIISLLDIKNVNLFNL